MYILNPNNWKIKPRLWGSQSMVKQAVLNNCEKIYGIDPSNIIVAMPFWERSGNKIYNYGNYDLYATIYGNVDWIPKGLSFGGTDSDYAEFSTDLAPYVENVKKLSIISQTVWGSSTADETIFETANEAGAGWWHEVIMLWGDDVGGVRNDCVGFFIGSNNVAYKVESTAGIKLSGVEHHVAGVYNANGTDDMNLYINGQLDPNSGDVGPENTDETVGLAPYIGKQHSGAPQRPHQGSINYLYFFNTALTEAQVKLFYDRPYGLFEPIAKPVYFFYQEAEEPAGQTMPIISDAGIHNAIFHGLVISG